MMIAVVRLKEKKLVRSKQNQPTLRCLPSPKITRWGLGLSVNEAALWREVTASGEARQGKQGVLWFPLPSSPCVWMQTQRAPSPGQHCPGLVLLGRPPCPPGQLSPSARRCPRGHPQKGGVGGGTGVAPVSRGVCRRRLSTAGDCGRRGKQNEMLLSGRWRECPRFSETYAKDPVCF